MQTVRGLLRQEVDVAISSSDASQSGCSGWQQRGIEAVLPEGELELHHTFDQTSITRGVKTVELGKTYDNRPQANDLNPDSDDLVDWGVDGMHLPDNSSQRAHPLDQAMTCLDNFSSTASGAVTALENDGYIWRAVDAQNGRDRLEHLMGGHRCHSRMALVFRLRNRCGRADL